MHHRGLCLVLCGDVNGKEIQKKGGDTCTHRCFTLLYVQQKLTQHCETTILPQKWGVGRLDAGYSLFHPLDKSSQEMCRIHGKKSHAVRASKKKSLIEQNTTDLGNPLGKTAMLPK